MLRRRTWSPIVLALVFFASPSAADDTSAIGAADAAFIGTHPEQWQGPPDLSFRAHVTAANGALIFAVEVTDDRVEWNGSLTDGIDVLLADAALVDGLESDRAAFTEQRVEVETTLNEDESTYPDAKADVLAELARVEQAWRAAEVGLAARVVTDARIAATPAAGSGITSRYEKTANGYRASVSVPLYGVISPANDAPREVRYLIQVRDVDANGAAAETLTIMASVARTDDQDPLPAAFHRIALREPVRIARDQLFRIAQALEPAGRFELRNGVYAYTVPTVERTTFTFNGACCTPQVCRPPQWEVFRPEDSSRSPDLHIFIGRSTVLATNGADQALLEIEDAALVFQARTETARYLVFQEDAMSRPGSPMQMCGAGVETSLIWIELSPALEEMRRQSLLLGSCWHDLEGDYVVEGTALRGQTVLDPEARRQAKQPITFRYDNERPERGVVITPMAVTTPSERVD